MILGEEEKTARETKNGLWVATLPVHFLCLVSDCHSSAAELPTSFQEHQGTVA